MMKTTLISHALKLTKLGDSFIKKSGARSFHEEAVALLQDARMHERFDFQNLVSESFNRKFSHEQNFKSFEFSDLPVTIARGEHCFIDLYFWRRRPTTIHNHHFTGAFQCLTGANVELKYKFIKENVLTKFHVQGELKEVEETRVLPGDIQNIDLQDRFIHQSYHQADITVNLCFRTPDFKNKNLANFFYPGFKYEKDFQTLQKAQRLYAYALINKINPDKINIAPEVALTFLIETINSGSSHPAIVHIQKKLLLRVKKEFSFDFNKLIHTHESYLDDIENRYA